MKSRRILQTLGFASIVLLGTVGSASADEWTVVAERTITSADPSVMITADEAKWTKEDIEKLKISVEGADVSIAKVVLHWANRPDDTVWNVGTVKAGGETAPKDAPGEEATLGSVMVQYTILGNATTAKLKLWLLD